MNRSEVQRIRVTVIECDSNITRFHRVTKRTPEQVVRSVSHDYPDAREITAEVAE